MNDRTPCVVWLTGISGAGKTTIARKVETRLRALGRHTVLLDGDDMRLGLNRDLGFSDADRVESTRRVAEVAKLMHAADLTVIVALISPFRGARAMARSRFPAGAFFEIHVDTPIEIAEARDPKSLYRKARRGEIADFTGIDSPYEAPEQPELRLDGTHPSPDALADQVIELLNGA
ncbi:adenylyl-sulfate kinase [Variovorax sp. RKNM96]|uniref:adenylyl-sulfate kinase n=1 Tax=Variovorax sp. RKNM96 TaxID=2681552 RepID=UPI0019815A93|nr:adenylyl-sulfate kinase [Variovorax sp. RKNM96]